MLGHTALEVLRKGALVLSSVDFMSVRLSDAWVVTKRNTK